MEALISIFLSTVIAGCFSVLLVFGLDILAGVVEGWK